MIAETEAGFQAAVVQLAELHGWRWWHDNDSRRNKSGFPDLVLVRDGVLIFAELKSETGRVSPAQTEWIGALEAVAMSGIEGVVEVHVWRPRDWESIVKVLSRCR